MGMLNKLKEYFGFRKPVVTDKTSEKSTKAEENRKKLEEEKAKFYGETLPKVKKSAANIPKLDKKTN